MKPPMTYAEWVACFDALMTATNDDEVMASVKAGQLNWSTGIAERFVKQLTEVISYRLKRSADNFSRAMKNACGSEIAIVAALLCVRREYKLLLELSRIPAIQPEYSKQLAEQIRQQADSAQQSLEVTAKTDRTGRLLSLIRNNRINNVE